MHARLLTPLLLTTLCTAFACADKTDAPSSNGEKGTTSEEDKENDDTSAASGGNSGNGDGDGDGDTPLGPLPDEHGWLLIWADEFEGESIDTSKWQHEQNCWGGGNNEEQCYVSDAKNSFVKDGNLHLLALKDAPSGPYNPDGGDNSIVTRTYSSARLNTKEKAQFKYGRFEARLQLPEGQGLWPAFWMLPSGNSYGGWARSGEIDIMEAVNTSVSNNEVHGTLHYGDAWPGNVHTGAAHSPDLYVADNFLVYAVEWEEGEIRWFVDGKHTQTQNSWHTAEGSEFPAPFNQDFHLLLNVAVGGAWPGTTNEQTTFPQEMLVDYVRVFECVHDTETGHGCDSSAP